MRSQYIIIMKNENDSHKYQPKKKPSFIIEILAWLILYGGPFLVVVTAVKAISAFIRSIT
jgi:hypothetical protein